jgi:hypothetical protein
MGNQTDQTQSLAMAHRLPWIGLLPVGGAVSGLLSVPCLPLFDSLGGLFFPAVFFAAILSIYLWQAGRPRSMPAVVAIVCWCIGGHLAAIATPIIIGKSPSLLAFWSAGWTFFPDETLVVTIAGGIGAGAVSLGFLTLLLPQKPALRIFLEVTICILVGTALAHAGPTLSSDYYPGARDWRAGTVVLWQTGMGCILGALCLLRAAGAKD